MGVGPGVPVAGFVVSAQPNDPELSRTRVIRRAQQPKTRTKAMTGNNKILDQRVGCNRWLGGHT
ncbi:MAG: hypothetical protein SVX38_15975, partial [Chloroflexota bacterium]|nr:hypothetical protein [Chloroflexota bacterium]